MLGKYILLGAGASLQAKTAVVDACNKLSVSDDSCMPAQQQC